MYLRSGKRAVAAVWFLGLLTLSPVLGAPEEPALVAFEGVTVPPVARSSTNELIDAGVLLTEGYRDVVLSLGGELKKEATRGGRIGAILVPDRAAFEFVRRNERLYPFPMEVSTTLDAGAPAVFLGDQVVARVAFPRYRVLFYNETDRTATVSLFAYRSH